MTATGALAGASTVTPTGAPLYRYAAGRLAQAIPLLAGVIVVNFLLVTLAPGDPVTTLLGEYPAPPEYVAQLRRDFGLDQPVFVRLGLYAWNAARGHLGFSFAYRRSSRSWPAVSATRSC
jgi:peptide/nickel transport system permease protein